MINKNTWNNISQTISSKWEKLENTLSMTINIQLTKRMFPTIQEWNVWASSQINKITNMCYNIISKEKEQIDTMTKSALIITYKKSNNQLDIEVERKSLKESVVEVILPYKVEQSMNEMLEFNNNEYQRLLTQTPIKIKRMINDTIMDANITRNVNVSTKDTLFNSLFKQTQLGIDKGYQVTYKNGRNVSFKSYMEMNVRTTIQNTSNKFIMDASESIGVTLFLASSHADCADDHKDYQGKIYLANNAVDIYNGKYQRIAVAEKVYFATRPNCRHYFTPITDEQEKVGAKKLGKQLDTSVGTYKDKNYIDLKQQRYNERLIRKYKSRVQNNEAILKNAPNDKKEYIKQQIRNDKMLVSKWQKVNRQLIDSNNILKRDYRRESENVIVQDLGAKYKVSYTSKV